MNPGPDHSPTPSPAFMRQPTAPHVWQARWFHLVMWAALSVALVLFLDAVRSILLPFVLAGIIAYLMDPVADRLEARRVHRGVAAAFITMALFAVVLGVCIALGPLLYHQLVDMIARAPELVREVEIALRDDVAPLFKALNKLNVGDASPGNLGEVVQKLFASMGGAASKLLASAAGALNVMGLLLITPIVCFYAIRDWDTVVARLDALLPRAYAPTIRQQLQAINLTLAAYLRGQLTVMLLLAVFYGIVFSILHLKYAILLGLLTGFLVIIPYIGTWVSLALGGAVAYSQFGLTTPFWVVIGVYVVGQFLESQILTPKIVGDKVGVHPLWLLFGMLAGGVLLGFVGVLLAVPLTAVISVMVKYAIERYLQSTLYTDA